MPTLRSSARDRYQEEVTLLSAGHLQIAGDVRLFFLRYIDHSLVYLVWDLFKKAPTECCLNNLFKSSIFQCWREPVDCGPDGLPLQLNWSCFPCWGGGGGGGGQNEPPVGVVAAPGLEGGGWRACRCKVRWLTLATPGPHVLITNG